jgi:nitronate monooxygenase
MITDYLSRKLDDYRLLLNGKEYVPIMQGGMGVDISTRKLAQVVASLGGIGTISDAMIQTVIDRDFKTRYVADKLKKYKANVGKSAKSIVQFDLNEVQDAQDRHVREAMEGKQGTGAIFINIMEKLTMNNPLGTLRARLNAALDAGIDGITLSAGLHLGSMELMKDNARFRDASIGIIVSSARALSLFLKKAAKLNRLPDFVIVEGPLAGGHLGFGLDWMKYNLSSILRDVTQFLREKDLDIPVVAAGGVFTGSDAVRHIVEDGATGVQIATRMTVTHECGLPDAVKQEYFRAYEEDIEVNQISPTGYPMRMIKSSPAIGSGLRPNCESYGYLLNKNGECSYIDAYNHQLDAAHEGDKLAVYDKTCLCTHMRKFNVWTCGQTAWRLKDTTHKLADGNYQILDAAHVFQDYQFSTNHEIALPAPICT